MTNSQLYPKGRGIIPFCRDEIRQIERDVSRDVQAARSSEPSGAIDLIDAVNVENLGQEGQDYP